MKKLLIFLVLVAAGYFAYDYFFTNNEIITVDGNFVKMKEGVNLDAPAIQPKTWGHVEGTVKNSSDKVVKDIVILYKVGGIDSKSVIRELQPGQEAKFRTNRVMLRVIDPSHYLENVTYVEL